MGGIALLALSFLVQIGLRMNYQQDIEQQTFRRALATAQAEDFLESQSINYNQFRNRMMPDASSGFGIISRALTDSSAIVTWGEYLTYLADDRDSQPRIIVHLDNDTEEYRSEDIPEDTPFVTNVSKEMSGSGQITTTNSSSSLAASTSETTAISLSAGGSVTSDLSSDVNFDW